MLDWRSISADPTNAEAYRRMDAFLRSITRIEPASRLEMILDFCRGKDVLDIGAGEHDVSFYSESWEHGRIRGVARRAVAAEIDPKLCEHYNAKGFDFRCVDATSEADLGERFDRIFCGDVIEHVNDPVALLRFAKRHLREDGAMLITTPNPFAPRFRASRRRRGTRYVIANLEHTRWISATNMHELCVRAGMELRALHWPLIKKRAKPGFYGRLVLWARRRQLSLFPLESVFHEYAFELAPQRLNRSNAAES